MDESDSRFLLFSSYFFNRFSLKIETWNKMLMNNEHKDLLVNFILNGHENMLVFAINTATQLHVSKSFPQDTYSKAIYFVRNKPIEINEENFHEVVSINEISPNLLDELDVLLADIFIPLVQSQCRQKILPAVITSDIERHICDFYSSLVQFQGVLLDQIVLPVLDCDSKISEAIEKFEDSYGDEIDIELKKNIEDSINNWVTDIRIILNENVFKICEKIKYPVPEDEIVFWNKRSKNLCGILNQLKNPRVKKMIKYLVMTESSYVTVYMDILKEIIRSIVECNSICKLFKPLEHQIHILENAEFLDFEELLQPTMNIVCCMWSYSKYYKEQNVILLLKEISNLLIEKATVLLNPNSIFDRDPLDVILNVQICYQTLQKFRLIFSKYRDNLDAFYGKGNELDIRYWNFKESEVFERLNQFMYRLKKLKDFLKASIEFGKLEEIVFGCLSGYRLTAQIYNLFEDYQKISNYFSTLQCNPFDTEDNSFFTEIHKFNESSKIADEKLTTIFKKAFDDCNNLENCYKLLTMIGPLLERKNIRLPFTEKYENLRMMVNSELDIVKIIFDHTSESDLKNNRFLPKISSEISWLIQLSQRIENAVEPFFSFCSEMKNQNRIELTIQKYNQMRNILTSRKEKILETWNRETPNICEKFLLEPLLIKNKNNRLELNFSQEFEILLKNIKFLKNSSKTNFSFQIESLYDRIEEIFNNRLLLHHLVRWHNFIITELHNMELQLIETEMTNFYDLLSRTLLLMQWKDNATNEIKECCRIIENIYLRILECKNNLNLVLYDIGLWKSIPLYERKRDDIRRDALINLQDSKENCVQRYSKIKNSYHKVVEMLEKNYKLFFNIREEVLILKIDNVEKKNLQKGGKKGPRTPKDARSAKQAKPKSRNIKGAEKKSSDKLKMLKTKPKLKSKMSTKIPNLKSAKEPRKNKLIDEKTSTTAEENERLRKIQEQKWDSYKEYVDALIVRELQEAVQISFRSLLNEMTQEEKRSPLFEIKLELQEPKLVFVPDLEMESSSGFCSIIESILEDIVGMANQMTRIDEKNTLNYGTEVTEFYVNSDMYDQILAIVAQAVNLCWDFLNQNFHSYSFLWLTDRTQYLDLFLKYGKAFKKEDFDALKTGKLKESPPKIGKFKEQFIFYDSLMNEVRQIKSEHVIDGWLKIDLRFVKASLENYVSKWSFLFKQHLIDFVSKTLNDFGNFNSKAIGVFTSNVSEENFEQLLEVMEYLNKVRDYDLKIEAIFASIQETIELLQFYKYEFPDEIYEQLDRMMDEWLKTKKCALLAKQNVAHLQSQHIAVIQKELSDFEEEHRLLQSNLKLISVFKNKETNEVDFEIFNIVIESLNKFKAKIDKNSEMSKLFDIETTEHKYVEQVSKEIKQVQQLKQCNEVIHNSIIDWKKTLWSKVDIEVIVLECKKYAKELYQSDKEVRSWNAFSELDVILKRMLMSLRSISELQNSALRDRHWLQLMQATGVKIVLGELTTLADLLNLNLHNYEEDVRNIVDVAVKELSMEKMLKELNLIWSQTNFEYDFLPDRNKLKILKVPETVIETIEDNQVQLQNLLTSKLIGYFAQEIMQWQKKLSTADQVLQLWFEVQRKWLYLEAIFVDSEDIRKQLKDNAKIFDGINKEFKDLLIDMETKGNIIKATNTEGLYSKLEKIIDQLNVCEKTLNEYLEVKRLVYPRFYFISSADLLDILSKGQEPEMVAKHLSKLYDNLAKLVFIKEGLKVTKKAKAMKAKDLDEMVQFSNICDCSGYVEFWLNNVTEMMRKTLRNLFQEAVASYENKAREIWINDYPSQVALCGTQIWWALEVNQAFFEIEQGYENALKEYQKKQINQLNILISLLLGDLSAGDRQKIMTVCTIDVHSRDVVAKMIQSKVDNINSFQWQSQLKHRWDMKKSDCFVNICDAQFCYQYEYLGNTPRLVITPLTDRCYITLTQSLHLVMGGAPAGPAGTGKTETTKDLGRALGVMVYVFNCSEQMDYRSIGNIYKGLSQTGAWGCFDEFNRISVEVLSVVAVQVKCIQDAIKAKKSTFNFVGQEIKLIPTVGIFITMNPGYAGRAELPENLKALFRPCAMVIPDFELICEIMLIAEGFHDAKLLARKFITLYRLCKELLSKQDHYDWGLRAIKSVLVVAGFLKRSDRQRAEDQVLMRALRDFNLPKIVTDDVPVFMGLINDLFPSLSVPRKVDLNFEKIIKEAAMKLELQTEDSFLLKVTQLEELLAVRHSVFIVGNAGTGKSMVWKTLFKAYQLKDLKPVYNDLNPKAVTNDELFGIIHPQTREWKDGLFSIIMREQANLSDSFGPKWIVLDGDIDPMWIESLNTVMDDNKVLTLASNERIALTTQMRLLFEISSLKTATPATVSRAGILYINAQDMGWNPYVTSWLEARKSSNERTNLQILFEKYIPPCLEAVRVKFKKIVALPEISHIQMLCYLLDCLLVESNIPSDCPKEWYEIYFVFAAIWAFGSALYQDQINDWRNEFSKWWINEFKQVKFPTNGTVFHYFVDPVTKKYTPWKEIVEPFVLDPGAPLQNTLVDIVETARLKYFMDLLMKRGYPVMIVGGAGTGKTALINSRLNELPESFLVSKMSFNYYTTSEMLQKALEKNLERKVGKNFGPPANRKLVHFIDDMNMPQVDSYGTVQPHTLLRQYMDYRHWYDRSKLCIKEIHNLQFVSAMNPTSGSFSIDSRLLRHFCVFSCNFPSFDSLVYMYTSILSQHIAFSLNRFSQQIQKIVEPLVNTAIILHQRISKTFLPTAIKFHYLFNLKDLTNIFQGLLFSNGEVIKTSMELVRLWYHESTRVYGDKLMDKSDNEQLHKLVTSTTKEYIENIDANVVFKQPLLFCHFAEGVGDEKYSPVYEFSHLKKLLDESLQSYNDLVGTLDLVLFEDAINHVCRITRILSSPSGNGLMVGVGGSGKQSLTRLAAFLLNLEIFQIQITKGYSMSDLKTDLAKLYIQVGVKNVSTVFMMTDSQIADERFLVLINDMLSTGDVADLFTDEETENIINKSRNEIKSLGLVDTNENCWNYFIGKIRKQLKIILCFSPIGNILRERSRKFPAIINCTTINWFYEWPEEALRSVSKRFLQDIPELKESLVEPVSHFMSFVHTSVNKVSEKYLISEKRYNYTTPKSFLEQISLFSKLLKTKRKEIDDRIQRLQNGLDKLAFTSSEVDELKKILAVQEIELTAKKEAADKIIKIVCEENEKVANEQAIASDEETKVRIIEEDVRVKAKVCAEDLAKAEPALMAAQEALKTLNKTNLTELKSFPTPPPAVASVTAAVMVLLAKNGVLPKDRSWKACKVMMGKVDQFLNDLINYNKENIHPEIVKEVKKYTNDANFRPELILSKSAAAAGLCAWVINTLNFFEIFVYVEPKRQALSVANSELLSAQMTLSKLKTKLGALEMQLNKLKSEFEMATAEKLKCQTEADATASAIDLANRLINGLSSENIRWRDSIDNLEKSAKTLPGDILLITAFISYMGCFTRQFRLDLFQNYWLDFLNSTKPYIPYDKNVDILYLLNDDAKIAQWNNENLPTDRISSENATILTNCSRWPLMIDPQLQAIKWIKKKYQNELIVTRTSSRTYLNTIEMAIESGNVILLEGVEETLDPVLDPILARNLIKKGTKLKIADKEINYNANFKLILHTKLANPHYKPELQAQTTLINFTVTRDGLEEQLLAEIVKMERADLEKLRLDLTTQRNDFKITLKFLEDDLLHKLSTASENILQDLDLIENLETTKKTSAEIEIKAAEASVTSRIIDQVREQYRPVAKRAVILYFILNDLHTINAMYQFSLKAFYQVFRDAINKAIASDNLEIRVLNLIDSITYSVFLYTTRGLFETDKLTFLTQMAFQILLDTKEIATEELNYLLRFDTPTSSQVSPVTFISNSGWNKITAMSQRIEFAGLDKAILGSVNRWKKFVESEYPEKEKFPEEWKNKNAVEKLCMMRALRPDRMIYALKLFIEEKLGTKYIQARQMNFAKSFEESSCSTPIFFILSPGVDPLKDVEKLGSELGYSCDKCNFYNISLGQGQEAVAEQAINTAFIKGDWVILQNIHLVLKWLPVLEKQISREDVTGVNENFRLFISAEPDSDPHKTSIPQGILESSIKITNEPPSGMKANLHKALDNFSHETLESSTKEAEFKAILFALCYFHAAVAGRGKFGAQGWNRSYPFNFGDLTISVSVLHNYLESNLKVPWEDIRYLFGEIMYGGHITDDWDRRLCRTYLVDYLKPELVYGQMNLASSFQVPFTTDYDGYHRYIDENLPQESPYLYGLHPNAEIDFFTTMSENLFKITYELQPKSIGASDSVTSNKESRIKQVVDEITDKLPDQFSISDLIARIEDKSPFVIVALQECERMNILLNELRKSLKELDLGLKGELTYNKNMEDLEESLFMNQVSSGWQNKAYPSTLSLGSWFFDLLLRHKELENWTSNFVMPSTVWLGGFFNPQSFLTAIMQQTARKNELPLDKMCLSFDVTKKLKDDFTSGPREGAYVNGLFLEGARWSIPDNCIVEPKLKELYPLMPVIFIKAIPQDKLDLKGYYECPVYKTKLRGPTFVWTFNLRTKERQTKWIIAGVAILFSP